MEQFYEKGVHLIDLVKHINSKSYINTRRKHQMEQLSIGDKVYMCVQSCFYA